MFKTIWICCFQHIVVHCFILNILLEAPKIMKHLLYEHLLVLCMLKEIRFFNIFKFPKQIRFPAVFQNRIYLLL
jgi:hypothetical protein